MRIVEIKKYLQSLKKYILFSSSVFALSILGGYIFALSYPAEMQQVLEEVVKEALFIGEEATSSQLFFFIFENNASKLFIMLLLGIFAGLIPFLSILANGMILGIVAQVVTQDISWTFFFLGILPHSIIEIPVLIVSTAIGMKIGKIAVWRIFGGEKIFRKEWTKAIKFYILVLAPLLFIAALIEAYITPALLKHVNI